jgi:hypothetical protein
MPDNPAPAPAPVQYAAPAPAPDPMLLDMGNLPAPGSHGAPGRIPYDRFHSVVQARDAVAAQAQQYQAELDAARAKLADFEAKWEKVSGWEEERATLESQWQTKLTQVQESYELRAIGLQDEDIIEAARWAYDRTPEEGRPPFVEALRSWAADPSTAPKILQPHLPQAKQPEAAQEAPQGQEMPPAPKGFRWPDANKGASASPPPAQGRQTITQAQYRELRGKGMSSTQIRQQYDVSMR